MKVYYPSWGVQAASVVASSLLIWLVLRHLNLPTVAWVPVTALNVVAWRRYLRSEVGADYVLGRSPNSFRRVRVRIEHVEGWKSGKLGSLAGTILISVQAGDVFIWNGAFRELRPRLPGANGS